MMNDETDAESASNTTIDDPGSSSYGSAIFSQSHHFTVAGGTFTNITKKYLAPVVPSDFRMIPMGEIDLQHEIRMGNGSGLIYRQRQSGHARRMYSAKVEGRESSKTVAIYQGDLAEEEWRRDVANYMAVRHPNIIQLHSAASTNNIHATVFYDDLIPFEQFLDRHSPLLKVYIYACCNTDFSTTENYFSSALQRELPQGDCTFWIRRSTGRLCVDLKPGGIYLWVGISLLQEMKPLDAPDQEAIAIDALTIEQYHRICYWNLARRRTFDCSAPTTVNLNTIIACPSGDRLEDSVEIALFPDANIFLDYWRTPERATGEVMEGGWTRFAHGDIFDSTLKLYMSNWRHGFWLSQANHIFCRLGITSNFEDYVAPYKISFELSLSAMSGDPPQGYLFLCLPEKFQTGPSSFRWPECPAYWSLDPSGVERLSMKDATALGFPAISPSTNVFGMSWDASIYAGLRQFHQAKGFDPDSQDVARHLGKPLYQLSREMDVPFAHVDDEESYSDEDNQDSFGMGESNDTHSLASEDGESTTTEEEAVPLPSVDDEDLCAEEVRDPLDIDEVGSSQNSAESHHPAEPMARNKPLSPAEEMPVSRAFKFFMTIQLALILFLTSV